MNRENYDPQPLTEPKLDSYENHNFKCYYAICISCLNKYIKLNQRKMATTFFKSTTRYN